MSDNPCAPPLLPASSAEKVPDKSIRALAILAGVATDIGGSLVAGFVIGVVMALLIIGGGGGAKELQEWLGSPYYLPVCLLISL